LLQALRGESPSEALVPPRRGITARAGYPSFGGFSRVLTRPGSGSEPVARSLLWYAVSLVVAITTLSVGLAWHGVRLEGPFWVLAALCLVAFVAERQSIQVTPYAQVSVSGLPLLFAAVVYGPFAAMLVGACAMLGDVGRPAVRWVIWTGSRALVGGLAGLAAITLIGKDPTFTRLLMGVAAAAVVEASADIALAAITARLRRRSYVETIEAMGRLAVAALPLYTPIIGVLAYAYEALSPWTVLLFFVPAVAAQRLFILYQEQRSLTEDLTLAKNRLEKASLSFATALVAALDARDRYTAGHSAAVAVYARDIAERLGLSEKEQQLAHLAGLVHDIGKVGLPAGLLEKPGPLTLEERRQMEEHSAIGERVLANVDGYAEIAKIVRHHHERADGNGYPDGLSGDEIPLVSRIICVADAYNAMTSDRPYREAMPSRVARFRLAQAAESQFDTTVVAAFEAILAGAGDTYLSGARADFALESVRHPALVPVLAEAVTAF
jgi:putative nucleotidyltransferase with HDIG domain